MITAAIILAALGAGEIARPPAIVKMAQQSHVNNAAPWAACLDPKS